MTHQYAQQKNLTKNLRGVCSHHGNRYDHVRIFAIIYRTTIMSWTEFLKSRAATWALMPVLVIMLTLAARTMIQKRQIDRQISSLETQAEKIKRDNEQLSGLIQYFNTPDYQEKQAREKLNLKKEGEYVVVLPNDQEVAAATQTITPPTQSNAKLWLNYFFHHETN